MKRFFLLLGGILLFSCTKAVIVPEEPTIVIKEDTKTFYKNPCMGWGFYDDAANEVQHAATYWNAQGKPAEKYGSFFYVRWRWSDMEPEEGKYAWIYNENYKNLIKGARDRGLKLCFRIYNNSQDNIRQSTPQYVRDAGAEGYTVKGQNGDLWTPYPDDPVFQEKLAKFIKAFAAEYDDPDIVDFIDGLNVGFWGECHHIKLSGKHGVSKTKLLDQITSIYADNFKRVLLLLPFGSEFTFEAEKKVAIDGKGYGMRRDGLGSQWFGPDQQKIVNSVYGKTLLVGESCWWGSSSDSYRPFESDKVNNLHSWRDVYELTYKHALTGHFNTLDLRELPETRGWITKAKELVESFCIKGGYRIHPTKLSFPESCTAGQNVTINHTWVNTGNGYLPNNMKNWDFKYKVAFALLDAQGKVIKTFVDVEAEPSEWLASKEHDYSFTISTDGIASGEYRLALAIVDRTKDNQPAIKLAIHKPEIIDGWYAVGKINLK